MSMNTPAGTRGARPMPGNPAARWMMRRMGAWHRARGFRFQGMDVLFLTTVGRKSGERREHAVSWFGDGDDAWLIVASAGGSVVNPAWYLNMSAHPDQVWAEFRDRKIRVVPEQLEGARREEAFQRIAAVQSRYAGYQAKTDREIPVIRLVPAADGG